MKLEGKPKKWMVPAVIAAVFLAILAAGFLMDHIPKATDSTLRGMLRRADDEQGRDALKVKLPRIGNSEPGAAAK